MSNESVSNNTPVETKKQTPPERANTSISSEAPISGSTPKKINPGNKTQSVKLPSIADIKSGKFELKKEEKKEDIELPTKEFSYSDFKHYWDEAISKIAAKNQTSTNVMIANLHPELKNETKIHLTFNNKVQLELFQTERPYLAGYLREKLQNFDIDFVIEINTTEQDNTPYTNAEKFKAMAAKNPNLQVLRDMLGLDVS